MNDYNLLTNKNDLPEGVRFDESHNYRNIPEPTDSIAPQFRSVAGRPMAGDMMITNGTSSNGLTGHAGIFLANGIILSNVSKATAIFSILSIETFFSHIQYQRCRYDVNYMRELVLLEINFFIDELF